MTGLISHRMCLSDRMGLGQLFISIKSLFCKLQAKFLVINCKVGKIAERTAENNAVMIRYFIALESDLCPPSEMQVVFGDRTIN